MSRHHKASLMKKGFYQSLIILISYRFMFYCDDSGFFVSPLEKYDIYVLQCGWIELSPIRYLLKGMKFGTNLKPHFTVSQFSTWATAFWDTLGQARILP